MTAQKEKFAISFNKSGRGKARCPANLEYPDGINVEIKDPKRLNYPTCKTELPYPAPECGQWIVKCNHCGVCIAVTAAGRADDPCSVEFPCADAGH